MSTPDWLAANRANWDERVPIHLASGFYDVAGFRAGNSSLRDFELPEVGDVTGRELLHLQCHFGLDTLSWARRGATVTGLDFSAPAIDTARGLAAEIGVDARFVVSDVYQAVDALAGTTYDIVYTGVGALYWLPDLTRWAETAAALVAPGGFLYLAEMHPVTDMFGDDGRTVQHSYFRDGPDVYDAPGTYADWNARTEHNLTYGWVHTLGDVVSAIAATGLHLEFLHEYDSTLFQRYPVLEPVGQTYRFPAGYPSMPMMYSLRAVKR